jgi:uncharacterized protein YaaQ
MSINQSSVKQYQMIRRYLSLIYLYGFFSREDFRDLLPESSASYDACISLIKDIYPEMHEGRFDEKRKYLTVSRKAQPGDLDRLCNTFFLCGLADDELVNLLELLEEAFCEPRNRNELANLFDELQSKSTVRRRIDELVSVGYLEQGERKRIQAHENLLGGLSEEALWQLYCYVRFCGNVTYPRAPARFLLRSLEREYLRRGLEIPSRQLFQFLNSPNHNVMEEDLVYTLLQAIRDKREVVMKLDQSLGQEAHTIIPFRLRIDRRLGRWYLLFMEESPSICKLSRIQSLALGREVDPQRWETLREQVENEFRYSRFSGDVPKDGPKTVRMRLRFGEERGLQRQFIRELRGGAVRHEAGEDIFTETINDPIELVPLLRSYSPWLEPVDPNDPVAMRIRDDLLALRNQLGEEAEP